MLFTEQEIGPSIAHKIATSGGAEDLDSVKMFVYDNDHDLEEKRKKAQRCTKCQRKNKGHKGKYCEAFDSERIYRR